MQFNLIKIIITFTFLSILAGCNGFFEKDNLPPPKPLVNFTPKISPKLLWSTRLGSMANNDYLKFQPTVDATAIYATSNNGYVSAVDKQTGRILWQTNTHMQINAGPGVGPNAIVVIGKRGHVMVLEKLTGRMLWHTQVQGEALAKPAVSADKTIIKTVDGGLYAYYLKNAEVAWTYQQTEPNLLLRGSSTPIIINHSLIAGFASGSLAKLNMQDGRLDWLETVAVPEGAFSIQRMVDIDADPLWFNRRLYAATYQGKIAAISFTTGETIWSQDISSYTGMVANNHAIYITDASGQLWSFSVDSGHELWKTTALVNRNLTAPTLLNNFVVVGDGYGYLHWIDAQSGRFAARSNPGNMVAAPITDDNIVYVTTTSGKLLAYTLR